MSLACKQKFIIIILARSLVQSEPARSLAFVAKLAAFHYYAFIIKLWLARWGQWEEEDEEDMDASLSLIKPRTINDCK